MKPLQQRAEFGREEVEIGLAARVASAEGGPVSQGNFWGKGGIICSKRESSTVKIEVFESRDSKFLGHSNDRATDIPLMEKTIVSNNI